jgi:hypothetical protein
MKKITMLIVAVLFAFVSYGQVEKVHTAPYDSVLAVETVYTGLIKLSGAYGTLVIQGLCTDVGGTPDGTLILQGSVDGTTFTNLAPETGSIVYRPNNDTLTITAGAVQTVHFIDPPYNYYRWKATGTANDSTLITTTYVYKIKK